MAITHDCIGRRSRWRNTSLVPSPPVSSCLVARCVRYGPTRLDQRWKRVRRPLHLGTALQSLPDPVSVRRIVILRANGLGDFLFVTPALRALADHFRQAEITFLCLPWLRRFLTGRYPYLARVHAIPPYAGIRDEPVGAAAAERQRKRFFAACGNARFDVAFQMHGGGAQSNPFVQHLGARLSVGLTSPGVAKLDLNIPYVFYQHEVLRYLEVVSAVGVPHRGLRMDVPERPSDVWELRNAFPTFDLAPFAIVHVGASDARRRWPIDRFAAVADVLTRDYGLTVVATGSHTDVQLVRQLTQVASVPIVDLSGWTSLGALAALVRRSRIVVSNDTGVSNLAIATDTPAVIIYWCGNVITAGPFYRGRHRPVLSWTVDCPACGRRTCACRVSFVMDATIADVLSQVDDLLGDGSRWVQSKG
jgi:ADP-heptose:LPS heptosyltransferase